MIYYRTSFVNYGCCDSVWRQFLDFLFAEVVSHGPSELCCVSLGCSAGSVPRAAPSQWPSTMGILKPGPWPAVAQHFGSRNLAETFPEWHWVLIFQLSTLFLTRWETLLCRTSASPAPGWTNVLGSLSLLGLPHTVDTFLGRTVVSPVWSANLCQIIVACETDLCHVFGFLDHLHSDNGEWFFPCQKVLRGGLIIKVSDETLLLLTLQRHPVWLRIETVFSNINWKHFWLYFLTSFFSPCLPGTVWSLNLIGLGK